MAMDPEHRKKLQDGSRRYHERKKLEKMRLEALAQSIAKGAPATEAEVAQAIEPGDEAPPMGRPAPQPPVTFTSRSPETKEFDKQRRFQHAQAYFNVYRKDGHKFYFHDEATTCNIKAIAEEYGGGCWQLRRVDITTETECGPDQYIVLNIDEAEYPVSERVLELQEKRKQRGIKPLDFGAREGEEIQEAEQFTKDDIQKAILAERAAWQAESEKKQLISELTEIKAKLANPALPEAQKQDLGHNAIDLAVKIMELANAAKGPSIGVVGAPGQAVTVAAPSDPMETVGKIVSGIAAIVPSVFGVVDLFKSKMAVSEATHSGGFASLLAAFAPVLSQVVQAGAARGAQPVGPAPQPAAQQAQAVGPVVDAQATPVEPKAPPTPAQPSAEELEERKAKEEAVKLENLVPGFKALKDRILTDMSSRSAPLETANWIRHTYPKQGQIGQFLDNFATPEQLVQMVTMYYPDETVKYTDGPEGEARCRTNVEWLTKMAQELLPKLAQRK